MLLPGLIGCRLAAFPGGRAAPDLGEELVLGEHPAAVPDQVGKQPELRRGQSERVPGAIGGSRFLVDEDVSRRERARKPAGSAQHRPHPREQLLQRKGLDEVVVGSQREAGDPVFNRVPRGQEQDRDVAPRAQRSRELESVAGRKHHVEHRQVWRAREQLVGVHAVGEGRDREPFGLERPPDRLSNRALVLDHNDPDAVCHPSSIAVNS